MIFIFSQWLRLVAFRLLYLRTFLLYCSEPCPICSCVTRFTALLTHKGTVVATACSAAHCKLPHGAYVLMRTAVTNTKMKACVVLVIGAQEKNRARKGLEVLGCRFRIAGEGDTWGKTKRRSKNQLCRHLRRTFQVGETCTKGLKQGHAWYVPGTARNRLN